MRLNTIAILVDLFRSNTVHLLLCPILATLLVRRRWRCDIGSINPNKRQIAICYRSRIPAISRETSQIAEKICLTFRQVRGRIRVGIGGPILPSRVEHQERANRADPSSPNRNSVDRAGRIAFRSAHTWSERYRRLPMSNQGRGVRRGWEGLLLFMSMRRGVCLPSTEKRCAAKTSGPGTTSR